MCDVHHRQPQRTARCRQAVGRGDVVELVLGAARRIADGVGGGAGLAGDACSGGSDAVLGRSRCVGW